MEDEHLVPAHRESQSTWIIVKIVFYVAEIYIFNQILNLFSVALDSLSETGYSLA